MAGWLRAMRRGVYRLRYPLSSPLDVIEALGIDVRETLSFKAFLRELTDHSLHSPYLHRLMPREEAEVIFDRAIAKDSYRHDTFFSYILDAQWLEVQLIYDHQDRLRRVYLHHKHFIQPIEVCVNPL